MKLAGRVAIVTGAGSGQGRAVAEAFAREGAAVTIAEVNAAAGEETAARIRAAGGGAMINVASVLGEVGSLGFAAYCASKHGVIGLTKEMALDLAPLASA